MEKILNSKKEKDSIYEIYRACRLCGGGAGYKMPIIQNIVDFDGTDVELKQKIRECVQIEVNQDDKMPPLICELCVDKVNDFYEFLEMCRQINKRTRVRLGLPPQSLAKGAPDAGDCILGLTEPVFVNDDSDGELPEKSKKPAPKIKINIKKEPFISKKKNKLDKGNSSHSKKMEVTPPRVTRKRARDDDEPLSNLKESMEIDCSTRFKKSDVTPPRVTRNRSGDDDMPLTSLKDNPLKSRPKSILKRRNSNKSEETHNLKSLKRTLHDETKMAPLAKKVKISIVPLTSPKKKLSPSFSPEELKRQTKSDIIPSKKQGSSQKREPSQTQLYFCDICGQSNKTVQARISHWKTHTVSFTNPKLACNPCGEWFPTPEESTAHHNNHTNNGLPYDCKDCYSNFKTLPAFDEHLKNKECIPMYEAPDVKCDVCWHMFPTYSILYSHDCPGEDHRPGGSCAKCNRSYSLYKNLVKHESTCKAKKKGELIVDENILKQLKVLQVRIARCDPLLVKKEQNHYDVKSIPSNYGLDKNCYYPFMSKLRLKSGSSAMVDIHDEIKKSLCSEDFVHWDSSDTDCSDDEMSAKKYKVKSLLTSTLKTIFSNRFLGKVPKKKCKVQFDKVFDSMESDDVNVVKIDLGNINNFYDDVGDKSDGEHCKMSLGSNDKNDSIDNDVKNESISYTADKSDYICSEVDDINNHTKSNENNDIESSLDDANNKLNNLILNDKSQDSEPESYSVSFTNGQSDNLVTNTEISHKDSKQISNNTQNSSASSDVTNNYNDKDISLMTESKTNLGVNDFSFDTI